MLVVLTLGLVLTAGPAWATHTSTCEFIDGVRVCTPDEHPNAPPTLNHDNTNGVVVDEGITASKNGTFSDPDGNATVTLSASVGTVTKNDANGTWNWSFNTSDGPSQSQTVTVTASDGEYTRTATFSLTVNNRNPVVMQLGYTSSLNEGGTATIRLLDPHDPSSVDTNAGFRYAFVCNQGPFDDGIDEYTYARSGTGNSTTCAYGDSGTMSMFARIFDKDDGYTQYGRSITVNNVAPTATFEAPATVDYGSGINLSLTNPSDPSSADRASLTYAFDCGDGNGYGAPGGAASKTCATPDEPTITVKGKVMDKDGGVNEYTKTVSVNGTEPTVSITSPNEGAYVRGTVTIRAKASDNVGVTRVSFEAGNENWLRSDFSAPYESSWDTTQRGDGNVTLRAEAIDDSGNRALSPGFDVVVDNTTPTGSVKINGGAAYTRSAAVNLSLSGSDLNGVQSVRFSNDGTNWSAWQGYAVGKSWTLAGGNGTKTVHVQYRDAAGNVSATARDTITLDGAKPTVGGMSPKPGSRIADTTPAIRATVRDNGPLAKANIQLYVAGKRIPAAKFRYGASGLLVYNSPKLAKGKKTVRIVVTDAAKNVGARSWYFTIK